MPRKKDNSLIIVNLRLRKVDVSAAKRRARKTGIPYQVIIRGWVHEGAGWAT